MSPKIVFVVAVVLQVAFASPCGQQRTIVQRSPGYPTRVQVPKVRTLAPKVTTVGAPCGSQVYTTRAPVLPAPTQFISAPGQVISAPGQIISAPGQVISAPGQVISTTNQVYSAPTQVISQAPAGPYLPSSFVDKSVSNSLVDTLSLLIVSDLIQSSRAPTVALPGYADVLPPVNVVETIAPAPVYTTYETYSPAAPVVTETVTGYSPYGATTTFVDVAGPSYVEYATGYGPNLVETVSYGGVTEAILAPELVLPAAQYTSYAEPLLSSYVAAPSCYY